MNEKGLDSGYILKVKSTGIPDGLDARYNIESTRITSRILV